MHFNFDGNSIGVRTITLLNYNFTRYNFTELTLKIIEIFVALMLMLAKNGMKLKFYSKSLGLN